MKVCNTYGVMLSCRVRIKQNICLPVDIVPLSLQIFVPRASSLIRVRFTETLYLDHVIQLIDEQQTLYKTLSDKVSLH